MVGSYEGNVLQWKENASKCEGGRTNQGCLLSWVHCSWSNALGKQALQKWGNTGFLFLKKHKIHLNSSVLPSVLNHLENISLIGTIVISVMLDFIPFGLHFYCFLCVFTVVFFSFCSVFFFFFFPLKFVICSELQRILWEQEMLNSTKETAP